MCMVPFDSLSFTHVKNIAELNPSIIFCSFTLNNFNIIKGNYVFINNMVIVFFLNNNCESSELYWNFDSLVKKAQSKEACMSF